MSPEASDVDRILTAIDRLAGDTGRTRWDLIAAETGLAPDAVQAGLKWLYQGGLIVGRDVENDRGAFVLTDVRRRHPGEAIQSVGDH